MQSPSDTTDDSDRVHAVADALAALGYDGIAAFDATEPEYGFLETADAEFDDPALVELLAITATTADYQLNGDAQQFWRALEEVTLDHGSLADQRDVKTILGTFMDRPVNARLEQQKRARLTKLFEHGFADWFLDTHDEAAPEEVWAQLADALETDMSKKTVVLAMKIYDIARLIRDGVYLDFPSDIPIPCDLQVERVARTSGLTTSEDTHDVMAAWAAVMDETSAQLDRPVSLLRIDSVVWQAGQVIGKHEPDREAARAALVEHFAAVGIDEQAGTHLANEFTAEL